MRGQQRQQRRPVEVGADRHRVGDGVGGEQLQGDARRRRRTGPGRQADLPRPVGRGAREVGGQRRLAAAALGGEHRDEPAARLGGRRRRPRRACSRSRRAMSLIRCTARVSPVRSRSSTTSRTPGPQRIGEHGGVDAGRTRTTPRLGRVTRIVSARERASTWSTLGPSTTQSSNTSRSRWSHSAARLGNTVVSGPIALRIDSAPLMSNSTIAVMGVALRSHSCRLWR